MRDTTFLARNATEGIVSLSSARPSLKIFDNEMTEVEGDSLTRAIEHTDAILDLYNETGRQLSADLVMSTLENVVQHATEKPLTVSTSLLEKIESLVWRLCDFDLSPSRHVLEALWEMQRFRNDEEKASKQVGRQVNLLQHWTEWSISSQVYQGSHALQPPVSFVVEVLRYATQNGVSMSFALWDLYESTSHDTQSPFDRSLYAYVLRLLSDSPTSWRIRQRRVCQDMIKQSRRKLRETIWPTASEIRSALEAAASVGRVQDAAWLMRVYEQSQRGNESTEIANDCRDLFVKALMRSEDRGALPYMKELLFSHEWESGIQSWKFVLLKLGESGETGAGELAKFVIQRIEDKVREDSRDWIPDVEIISHVIQAYLNEPRRTLAHVSAADKILRRIIVAYDIYAVAKFLPEQRRPSLRLFDTVLKAYDDYTRSNRMATEAADDLFRFFLIQHRNGKVLEEPDRFHLGHILRCYNRQNEKQLLQQGAWKSLEYFRLLRSLYRRQKISTPPDLFNARQLLGTLARSTEAGLGSTANEILQDCLTMESPIHPYALGHMYWCVVKCYCSENRLDDAFAILDRWEDAFTACPSSIRLTGAPYQTMIHALSVRKGDTPGENASFALALIERFERQYMVDNGRLRLRHKMYKEALQCCRSNEIAKEKIQQSFTRMNFTLSHQ
jgi:hypothetical protein